MDKLNPILIGFLIIALCNNSVFTNPSEPRPGPGIDNDYNYEDEEDSGSSETNNVAEGQQVDLNLIVPSYSIAASVGENLELDCAKYVHNYNESKDVLIIWYNGTTSIVQGSRIVTQDKRIELGNNSNLIIKNIQYEDANNYLCQIHPGELNLTVRVQITPTIRILSQRRDVMGNDLDYDEGAKIEFDCTSDGKTGIVWSLGGDRVEHLPGIRLEGSKMIIDKADHTHTGIYQCLADGIETVAIGNINITIKVHPKVSTPRKIVNVKDGITKELKCTFTSNPTEQILWKKDNVEIIPSEKYQIFNDVTEKHKRRTNIIINNIVKEDIGSYRCEVINHLGKGHADIELTYLPEPAHFDSYEFIDNQIHINWTIHSYQALSDILLYYQLRSGKAWQTEKPIKYEKNEHGIWKIQHRLRLEEGEWATKVKSHNADGGSIFSEEKIIIVPKATEIVTEIPIISKDGQLEQQQEKHTNGANFKNLSIICFIFILCNIFLN